MKKTKLDGKPVYVPATVVAYACGRCSLVYMDAADAAACCCCAECGEKFARETSYASTCGHCGYGTQLRHARQAERRAKDELNRAEIRLKALLAQKRPPKGSPP